MPDFQRLKRRARRLWKNRLKRVVPIVLVAVLAAAAVTVAGFAILRPDVERPATQAAPKVTPKTPTATASATANAVKLAPVPAGSTVLFVGDSWSYSVGADEHNQGFPYVTAEALKVTPDIHGYGSVGYVNKGSDKFGAFQARLAYDKPTGSPSLVVLQGSQNDAAVPPAQITVAARALVADVRSRFPAAQVVMVGPAPATAGLIAALAPVDAALTEAAEAERVPYVSPLRDGWFTSATLSEYMNPMDGSPHPNTAGHQRFGALLASSIQALQKG